MFNKSIPCYLIRKAFVLFHILIDSLRFLATYHFPSWYNVMGPLPPPPPPPPTHTHTHTSLHTLCCFLIQNLSSRTTAKPKVVFTHHRNGFWSCLPHDWLFRRGYFISHHASVYMCVCGCTRQGMHPGPHRTTSRQTGGRPWGRRPRGVRMMQSAVHVCVCEREKPAMTDRLYTHYQISLRVSATPGPHVSTAVMSASLHNNTAAFIGELWRAAGGEPTHL